ncbi:hypothetical protein C8R47DRAFT_1068174 [Mycena vitilis]|nr:hypothetical protein C8R47DRAFT_1068174 [Mycena vitilis]
MGEEKKRKESGIASHLWAQSRFFFFFKSARLSGLGAMEDTGSRATGITRGTSAEHMGWWWWEKRKRAVPSQHVLRSRRPPGVSLAGMIFAGPLDRTYSSGRATLAVDDPEGKRLYIGRYHAISKDSAMAPHHPHVGVNDRAQQIVSVTYPGAHMIQASLVRCLFHNPMVLTLTSYFCCSTSYLNDVLTASSLVFLGWILPYSVPFTRCCPQSPFLLPEVASDYGGSMTAGRVDLRAHRPRSVVRPGETLSKPAARPASLESHAGLLYFSTARVPLLPVSKPQQPHIAARRVIKPMRSTRGTSPLCPIPAPPSIVGPHATEVSSFGKFGRYPEPEPLFEFRSSRGNDHIISVHFSIIVCMRADAPGIRTGGLTWCGSESRGDGRFRSYGENYGQSCWSNPALYSPHSFATSRTKYSSIAGITKLRLVSVLGQTSPLEDTLLRVHAKYFLKSLYTKIYPLNRERKNAQLEGRDATGHEVATDVSADDEERVPAFRILGRLKIRWRAGSSDQDKMERLWMRSLEPEQHQGLSAVVVQSPPQIPRAGGLSHRKLMAGIWNRKFGDRYFPSSWRWGKPLQPDIFGEQGSLRARNRIIAGARYLFEAMLEILQCLRPGAGRTLLRPRQAPVALTFLPPSSHLFANAKGEPYFDAVNIGRTNVDAAYTPVGFFIPNTLHLRRGCSAWRSICFNGEGGTSGASREKPGWIEDRNLFHRPSTLPLAPASPYVSHPRLTPSYVPDYSRPDYHYQRSPSLSASSYRRTTSDASDWTTPRLGSSNAMIGAEGMLVRFEPGD